METISKAEFLRRKDFFIKEMQKGKIFVYPTDTIYGIGCDATNSLAVDKIRLIKQRDAKPFSVIAPGKHWIERNCLIVKDAEKWIDKLPGKYTLILNVRNKTCVAGNVNNLGDTLGIRIPDNWFFNVVQEFGKPFITTSVNLSGGKPIKRFGDLDESLYSDIDYFVDEGTLDNPPSTIVNLTEGEKIINRN